MHCEIKFSTSINQCQTKSDTIKQYETQSSELQVITLEQKLLQNFASIFKMLLSSK